MKNESGRGSTPGPPTVLAESEGQTESEDETTKTKSGQADETVIAMESLGLEETTKMNATGVVTSANEAETGQDM